MVTTRETVVVRIPRKVHDRAMRVKDGTKDNRTEYMDKASWIGYLIQRGLENL